MATKQNDTMLQTTDVEPTGYEEDEALDPKLMFEDELRKRRPPSKLPDSHFEDMAAYRRRRGRGHPRRSPKRSQTT